MSSGTWTLQIEHIRWFESINRLFQRSLSHLPAINANHRISVPSRALYPELSDLGPYSGGQNARVNIAATDVVEMATVDVHVGQAITPEVEGPQIPGGPITDNENNNGDLEGGESEPAPTDTAPVEPLYSVLTARQKQVTVMIVSFVAMISPLSGNIYYPAIPALTREYHVSTALIQLTVTLYQVSQFRHDCRGSPRLHPSLARRPNKQVALRSSKVLPHRSSPTTRTATAGDPRTPSASSSTWVPTSAWPCSPATQP